MAEALDLTDLPAGLVLLDKYRVEGTLGIGGMGVVVAAMHLALDTKVAIKFLLPQLVSNELVVACSGEIAMSMSPPCTRST